MALQPITPTRRSERFQPTIFHASLNQNDRTKHLWQGQPVATRPPTAEDLVGDDRIDEAEKAETRLYEALARATRTEVKRARKAMMKNETTIFSLGDTILVSPEAANKLPGIAVITSMWEVQGSSDGVHCEEPMKIRIHWFLRPRQMATIRAHKSYLPVSKTPSFHSIQKPILHRTKSTTLSMQRLSSLLMLYSGIVSLV